MKFFKTPAQKTQIALRKLDVKGKTSLGKTIAKEASSAIKSVAGSIAARKTVQAKYEADVQKRRAEAEKARNATVANIEQALNKWTSLLDGNPDKEEGKTGQTQTGNTGSYLGG